MNPFEGHVPGGVLKTVVEEHQSMDEFIQLLKRRVDLDEKYNRDLATLCDTFNAKWKDLATYPLFSPILAFFKNEITTCDTTCESIKAILDEVPTADSPDKLEEGGSMLEEYQKLIDASERVKECKEIASSRDSVAALDEWLNKEAPKSEYGDKDNFITIREWSRGWIAGFILPESDREYRQSVHLQQPIARKVSDWHSNNLPDMLERHQTRSENIKAALQKVGNSYSEQSNRIVKHVSEAKDRLDAFSSVDWIAPKHEGQSLESSHELMEIASYVNSVTGKSSSVIVYGLKLEQVEFMEVLRMKIERLSEPGIDTRYGTYWRDGRYDDRNSLLAHCIPSKRHALELERQLSLGINRPDFSSLSRLDVFAMASFYLLSSPPILSFSEGEIDRYREAPYKAKPSLLGRLRQKESWMQVMESIMDRVAKEDRTRAGELVLLYRRKLLEDDDTTILTHSRDEGENMMVEGIIRKWDFDLWRPFPVGIERKRGENGDWVVSSVTA